jgi:glycosyltransferase involved in cell wall biosynthesis
LVPRITVIIPTYNRWPMLGEAIESVLGQTYPGFELIVVDDGSTDETVARLNKYRSRLRLISQGRRKGVSAARNVGAGEARGSLLAFLDSDDLWRPTKLAFQADFMELHPEIAVCQTEEIWIRNGVRVNARAIHRKPDGDIFLPSLDLCLVSPSAVMMRRDLFVALGGFDEALPVCEDYDLWLRIAIDHQVALMPELLAIKRGGHADQLSHSVWGMDRFRVIALQKLLRSDISRARREAAVHVLRRKVRILAQGARKRGKEPEALEYEAMLTEFDKESRNVGDSDSRARPSQRFSSANAGTLA